MPHTRHAPCSPAFRGRRHRSGERGRYDLGTAQAILKAVKRWLDRLSLWQWAVLNAFTSLLAIAIVATIIQLTHHASWGGIGWWVVYGVSYAIFFAGWSTLLRHLRMRRRRERGPHVGQMAR
jgi:hypothetical protein